MTLSRTALLLSDRSIGVTTAGEGHEEFGGADVHDVLNLIPLAKSLGYVDMSNVFMFGESRGGMMAYLTLTNNIPVNAVATIGGLVDLIRGAKIAHE